MILRDGEHKLIGRSFGHVHNLIRHRWGLPGTSQHQDVSESQPCSTSRFV